MRRLLNDNLLDKVPVNNNLELVKSLNGEHCVTDKTQIIIVGTITPPKACGYFYTSPYNCVYGYIDEVRGANLKVLKKKLKTDASSKSEIIKTLQQEKIAFLDIMKRVIRKKDSSADDDIKNFSLDYDVFEKVFTNLLKNENVKIICNSRLAEAGYNKIKESLWTNRKLLLPESIYISQVRRLQKTEKPKWLKDLV